MKIRAIKKSYAEVVAMPKEPHRRPMKQSWFFRKLLQLVSLPDLFATKFTYEKIGMEKLGRREPALILMNHSSFVDLEIVAHMFSKRPYNIVATTDCFAGMSWLIRALGCIPTKKFVNDATLVRDMMHVLRKYKSSVVMFPEASYSFDGTATTLPKTLGKCIKMLGVPVVMVTTHGAFSRDPLYNNLQRRKVKVSATQEYLLSAEDTKNKSIEEIDALIAEKFSFDNFRWQKENKIKIDEPTRADYLNRVLYKCPACKAEGKMLGKGINLTCTSCGKVHTLTEYGALEGIGAPADFTHIPDWYRWERDEVRREIEDGKYRLELPVKIFMMRGLKCLYDVGEGVLTHNADGFRLVGCEGELNYEQKPLASYGLYSDFNWYEIADTICIGNNDTLYYCFPKVTGDCVAKARLAAEELYKIAYANRTQEEKSDNM